MNFVNVSAESNAKLTQECDLQAKKREYTPQTVEALLACVADVDPLVKAGTLTVGDTPLTTATRNIVTCSFLKDTEKTAEKGFSAEEMRTYPPFGDLIEGSDVSTLLVLQSEYGVIVPPIPSSADETIPPCYIASPDATSCLIIAARAVLKGAPEYVSATALGHFDRDGDELIDGLKGMYVKSLLPSIGDQIRLYRASQAGGGGAAAVPDTPATVTIEWYFVGGMINTQYTQPCIGDFLVDFMRPCFEPMAAMVHAAIIAKAAGGGKFKVEHALRPDGQCFWTLNTYKDEKGRHSCTIRGLRVDAVTGASHPFEMRAGKRDCPFGHVRGTRFATEQIGSSGFVPINVRFGEAPQHYRITVKEPQPSDGPNKGAVITLDFQQYLAAVRDAIAAKRPIPVVCAPALFDKVPGNYAFVSADRTLMMSTTPHCEPVDFAVRLADNFKYAAKMSTATAFGKPPLALINLVAPAKQNSTPAEK